MHDLFTRGIGADGQLRPPREQAPELYWESAIGWIPKEWEVKKLRECIVDNPTNGIYKSQDQIGDGALMIGQTAFTKERSIDFSLCRRGAISEAEKKQYAVSEDNILITRVFATIDGVGLPTLIPQMYEKAVFESNMIRLRVDGTKIYPLILFEWLRHLKVRALVVSGANASNQVSINQKTLNDLPIPLIGINEQSRIVSSMNAYNSKASIEKMHLKKLKQQKSGLMHDLLTGKVQVNIDDAEVTHG
jgi:type I restriction enzyme, S subunit